MRSAKIPSSTSHLLLAVIPCLSFCHMMLDGEQYHDAGQNIEEHYLDIVPLDKWRAEHTGRQWGPPRFCFPISRIKFCTSEAPPANC